MVEGASTREGELLTNADRFCVGHGQSATGNEQRGGEAAGAGIAVCDCLDSDMEGGGKRGGACRKDMSGFFNLIVFICTICSRIHWR